MKSNQSQFKSLKYAAIALFAISSTNVVANQKFSTLEGIPAKVMSHQDLSIVEGKSNLSYYVFANQYGISNPQYRNPFPTNFIPSSKTKSDATSRVQYMTRVERIKILANIAQILLAIYLKQ